MKKVKVRFNEKGLGTWADEPWEPQFEVKEAGEVHEMSLRPAQVVVDCGKGEFVNPESEPASEPESKSDEGVEKRGKDRGKRGRRGRDEDFLGDEE